MMKPLSLLLASLPVLAILASASDAGQRMERLTSADGMTSAEISGRIKGDDGVGYVVGATQGQTMSVAFTPENPRCYFDVLEPGAEEKPLHDGANGGNSFSGTLPISGDYVTRVYLMENAAKRDEICDYSIKIDVTG
jgi:hypothetical protein